MSSDKAEQLLSKAEEITSAWVKAASNRHVGSGVDAAMTYEAVYSRLPQIIDLVAIRISSSESLSSQSSSSQSSSFDLYPITIGVNLGFDINELLRSFRTLRALILSTIELAPSGADVAQICMRVDEVLDSITASSVSQYVAYQLEQSEPMHKALLSSNQALIRVVQKQKDNASHLAHELKNPLNVIVSLSSILLRKWTQRESKPQETQYVERILENGQRILSLITNMLETSRKASQKPPLNVEQVEMAKLIERVAEAFDADATAKDLTLNIDCTLAPPIIHTDTLRLQQILVNLISNAIRYTDEGEISIRCYSIDDKQWVLAVADTGRGISRGEQAGIFKPYVRAGSEDSHLSSSSGLGLAIVSKLVELLQGELELVSEPGVGSTFTVKLPLDVSEQQHLTTQNQLTQSQLSEETMHLTK